MSDLEPARIKQSSTPALADNVAYRPSIQRDFPPEISPAAAERIRNSKSPNTVTAYRGDVSRWAKWCRDRALPAVPAERGIFADYVSHLCDEGKSPATIQRAMAAIRKLHEEAGYEDQPHAKLARDVLLGYRRELATTGGRRVRKATPISRESLRLMVETCDLAIPIGCRDHLILVLGMGLMGRRSELVSLNLDDVWEDEDRGLVVHIAMSKTDKAAAGEEVAIGRGIFDQTDPVASLRRWRAVLDAHAIRHGRLLRSISGKGRIGERLPVKTVNAMVKARARQAGLVNPDGYSGHSLRSGGMTASLREGTPLGVAAAHGRWSPTSPVVIGYARTEDRWRDNAMKGVL